MSFFAKSCIVDIPIGSKYASGLTLNWFGLLQANVPLLFNADAKGLPWRWTLERIGWPITARYWFSIPPEKVKQWGMLLSEKSFELFALMLSSRY